MSDAARDPELRLRFDADAKQDLGKWQARRRLGQAMRTALSNLFERDLPERELDQLTRALEQFSSGLTSWPRLGYALFRDQNVNAADVMAYYDKSPIIGLASPLAAPVVTYQRGDDRVEARATFGSAHEGVPGCVHGGIIASVFDEVLSFAQPPLGQPGMTASLTIRYKAPTPLHRELVFEAALTGSEGRKIFAKGHCRAGDTITAEAEALFIRITDERRKSIDAARS
jgi:acyl-coenzyme A thioesterase PaaI-like protein